MRQALTVAYRLAVVGLLAWIALRPAPDPRVQVWEPRDAIAVQNERDRTYNHPIPLRVKIVE
jgi:hypothetical protein